MVFGRDTQFVDLASLAVLTLLWACGGVLLTAAVMRPHRRERLLVGLGVGLLLFVALSNGFARVLPTTTGFWAAALIIFLLGLGAAAWSRKDLPLPGVADLPYAILFLLVLYVAILINRGLSILDDYHSVPLVSVMAAGNIPPDFYLNDALAYAYHYGLHVVAASLVDLGGFTPWGAYDVSKALTLAMALALAALWIRRTTSRVGWIAFGTAVFAFLGGSRWLLLLAPARWMDSVAAHLTLLGSAAETGPDLQEVLLRPWAIAGGGPLPFPFAFLSGIRAPATFVALGGSALLPEVTLLLLLLLYRRRWQPTSILLFAVLLSTLALTSELLFLLAVSALAGGHVLGLILARRRSWVRPPARPMLLILGISLTVAWIQGGVLTQIFRSLASPATQVYGFAGIALNWPPRIVSAHLGGMQVTDPNQLLLSLIEAGPAILLMPLALVWSWQHLRRGSDFPGGLAPLALALATVGLVVEYEILRETSRFLGTALMVWTVFGLQPMTVFLRDGRNWARPALVVCLFAGMFGGLVLLATDLVAAAKPTRTYFVSRQDSVMADLFWDRLEPGDAVFDSNPYRAVTLFGRPTRSHRSYWETSPEYDRLVAAASPSQIVQAGYRYVYMDDTWWSTLSPTQRTEFTDGCPWKVHEEVGPPDRFRILYDLERCDTG
jgi:hypothetical protein